MKSATLPIPLTKDNAPSAPTEDKVPTLKVWVRGKGIVRYRPR